MHGFSRSCASQKAILPVDSPYFWWILPWNFPRKLQKIPPSKLPGDRRGWISARNGEATADFSAGAAAEGPAPREDVTWLE